MSRIYLDPPSVNAAGTTLLSGSAKLAGAGRLAGAALNASADLPPAYQGRASSLAARTSKCTYAADAMVAVGLELQKRAGLAAAEDAKNFGIQSPFGRPNSLATSKKLNFWNEKTRKAARKTPGRFFDDADKILGLSTKNPVPRPAGAGRCRVFSEGFDPKFIAELGRKSKASPDKDKKDADKNRWDRSKDKVKAGETALQMLLHQYKAAGRPVPSLSPTEMKAFIGLWAQAQAGGRCDVALGKGYEASLIAAAKAVAKLGAEGSISKKGARIALIADLSVKAEVNGSLTKGGNKITASGAAVAGLKAIAKADVGNDKGKLNANVNLGLALGLGLEGSVGITVDLSGILYEPPPPPRAVGLPRPDGLLVIKKAQ